MASAATAAVSARRMRGPSAIRDVSRPLQQHGALLLGKSAFRADQHRERRAAAGAPRRKSARSAATGSAHGASSSQNTRWRDGASAAIARGEIHRGGDLGMAEDAALLRRLDGVGPHALEIDPLGLGVAHHHRRSRDTPISTAFCTM